MRRKLLKLTLTAMIIAVIAPQSFSQFTINKKKELNGQIVSEKMKNVTYVDMRDLHLKRTVNMDTLVYLNFDTSNVIPDWDNGGPWFNFSYDQLATNSGDPTVWFQSDSVAVQDIANGDTLRFTNMGLSISWMQGFAIGNRNALSSPALTISQPGAVLRFSTMPVQGPQWSDGISIKVDDLQDPQNSNADTLIQLKQYRGSGDGPVWHPSFGWDTIPGDTMHTAYNYDPTLATFTDSGNATVALMDFELSLDAYVGQTIYITFYHDSDDDNGIFLDDILVMQPLASGLQESHSSYSKLFPNPTKDEVVFEFNAFDNSDPHIELLDINSRLIKSVNVNNDDFGVQRVKIMTSDLKWGLYFVKYFNGKEKIVEKLFIK